MNELSGLGRSASPKVIFLNDEGSKSSGGSIDDSPSPRGSSAYDDQIVVGVDFDVIEVLFSTFETLKIVESCLERILGLCLRGRAQDIACKRHGAELQTCTKDFSHRHNQIKY